MLRIHTSERFLQEKAYVFRTVFDDFLGIAYGVEYGDQADGQYVLTMDGFSGRVVLPDVFFSMPDHAWLKEASLPTLPLERYTCPPEVRTFYKEPTPVLYGAAGTTSGIFDIPIDIFGGIFFCLSLYEECVRPIWDGHERFSHEESLAVRENYYHRPIVNEYLEILWMALEAKFRGIARKKRDYRLVLSHDVDWPLAGDMPVWEFMKECYRDLRYRKSVSLAAKRIMSRCLGWTPWRYRTDPYNNFGFLMGVSEEFGVRSEFNFICTDGKNHTPDQFYYDNYYDIDTPFFGGLIAAIYKRGHKIGFHPSYYTLHDPVKFGKEFDKFKRVCGEAGLVESGWGGRHHYLRWQAPGSWAMWEDAGLVYDSSVGSEFLLGFRCGTCYSFTTYDLARRKENRLREYPLTVMDLTVFQNEDLYGGLEKIMPLKSVCSFYGGDLTLLVHNNYVVTPKWKRFYREMIHRLSNFAD
jgi:hypothetical protein